MPARRNKRKFVRKNREGKSFPLKLVLIALLILFPIFVFFYLANTRKYWNGVDKVSVVVRGSDEVKIIIFDPALEEIIQIVIPGNTQVEVAKNLGLWKLESVWELGEKEGSGGKLLTRTIAKHFKFPVFVWADSQAGGFWAGSPLDVIKASFVPYESNLGVGDKVSIGLFALGVKNPKKFERKLEDTRYLANVTLTDGEEGFIVDGPIPQDLSVLFVDQGESSSFRVGIKDGSGKAGLAEDVGAMLEVLGGKITSIENINSNDDSNDLICEVSGKEDLAAKVSEILPCSLRGDIPGSRFDVEVSIGRLFLTEY